MKFLDYIKLSKIIQTKNGKNRNRAAFRCLRELGFSLPAVRGMLIKGNDFKVSELAREADVTAPTIYAVAYGIRKNQKGRAILARALGMDIKELFPDGEPRQRFRRRADG